MTIRHNGWSINDGHQEVPIPLSAWGNTLRRLTFRPWYQFVDIRPSNAHTLTHAQWELFATCDEVHVISRHLPWGGPVSVKVLRYDQVNDTGNHKEAEICRRSRVTYAPGHPYSLHLERG